MRSIPGAGLFFIGFAAFVGCGDSANLLPATGTVTHQGKPVEGAVVTFMPESSSDGQTVMGVATTDAAGKYEILTRGKSGATPGKNAVSIAKQSFKEAPSASMSPDDMKKMYQKTQGGGQQNLLPVKYSNPAQSGLSADVQSGKSVFDFDLKD